MTRSLILALATLAACHGTPPHTSVTTQPASHSARVPVHSWMTTGDQSRLLNQQPDIYLSPDSAPSPPTIATIEVDDRKTYQQMIGFGAAMTDASAYLMQRKMSATDREALLQDLFGRNGGIGLSFIRVPMGASDFSLRRYSYDDVPASESDSALSHFSIDVDRVDKLPLLKRALAINPQLKVMASPWSPPGWMKTSGSLIKGTLLPKFYDSFANYFVKFIRAYEAEGVPVYAISLQNEPNYEPPDYPGMQLDAAARASVIADHIGPRFAQAGIRTLIWDWDHNWDVPQSPLAVLANERARQYVQGIAWHCYAGDVSVQSTVHDAYSNKDAYFSECSGGEWSPKFADNLKWFVNTLVISATRNWARGVALWNLALDEHGGPHAGGCGNCRGVVTIDTTTGAYTRNVEYYALGHASRFARVGAYRIDSHGGAPDLASVAFRNADDNSKVLIVLNSADHERTFAVRSAGKSFRYILHAVAVVTFTWM